MRADNEGTKKKPTLILSPNFLYVKKMQVHTFEGNAHTIHYEVWFQVNLKVVKE